MMMSTVIGGAMLPHAPQFFTMPETEDKKNVEHVREVAADIGSKLRALQPDLWIIFSNDHAEQFFHNAAPPFTVHVGGEASGEFAGRRFHWKIPRRDRLRDRAPALSAGTIPLHLDRQDRLCDRDPVDPHRSYRPRSADLRKCLSAAAAHHGALLFLRAGGRAHRHRARAQDGGAGERRHVAFSRHRPVFQPRAGLGPRALEKLTSGNLKSLIGYDEAELDDTGNIELRCWACAAGALGERKPDVVSMDPSWHHNYASLAWTGGQGEHQQAALSCHQAGAGGADLGAAWPGPRRRVAGAVHGRRPGFCRPVPLAAGQREALIKLDLQSIVRMGAHPLVPFLAQLQIQRLRPGA